MLSAYILQQLIIEKKACTNEPKVIFGYVEDDQYHMYWRHFWVECDGITYDPGTGVYWNLFPKEGIHTRKRETRRIVEKTTTTLYTFTEGTENIGYIQSRAYNEMKRGKFWNWIVICELEKHPERIHSCLETFVKCQARVNSILK